ncbi:secreted RxLR effector protein 161-like [Pistacia vera]|uniref:secreted RxLR effector protein 161-like n=1 Tax=Pistacia vera TaxID=55513 RepID=UPI001262E493|nr:secreted RxLR effector protein 161-like [Pistacia vera]
MQMETVPYSNVIGSVMYAMISTRPDLAFAISLLSRYMSNPGSDHWIALKWVLRYINSTACIGLEYCKRTSTLDLVGFVDSDFAGDRDNKKSTTTHRFTLGGNCISWKSQLQPPVALSSTEAEYVALADGFKEAIWMQGLLTKTELTDSKVTIFSDGQSAILLSKNPIYHERTKHVDVRFHFIRDLITKELIELRKVPTEENPADIGTKIVTPAKFKHCMNLLFLK